MAVSRKTKVLNPMGFNDDLRQRTKLFAIRIIKMYQALPKTGEARVIGNQILRSGTSMAANFRSATNGRSRKEFFAKLCIAIEEADETLFWMEILEEANIVTSKKLSVIKQECFEIVKILSSSRKKFKDNENGQN